MNQSTDAKIGRNASHPKEIPPRGLRDVVWRVAGQFSEDRITLVAAGVTYYALLAIFPALSLLVSIYGLFLDPSLVVEHARAATAFLPAATAEIFTKQLQALAGQKTSFLSVSAVASLIFALWSAHNGVLALFAAMNAVYGEREKRGFLRLNAIGIIFTIGGIVSAIFMLFAIAAIPILLQYVWLGGLLDPLAELGRWPLLALMAFIISAVLYRYGPSRENAQVHWLSWGSLFTGIGWCVVSVLYSLYLENFANFQATYGTLGALVGFMIWLWLSAIVLLLGAEINAELEHQTTLDTTTGQPKPMGQRGAHVADTVGKSISDRSK